MVKGVRFQVQVNGAPVCTAGMPAPGVLQVTIEADDWPQEYTSNGTPVLRPNQTCKLSVGGTTLIDANLEWRQVQLALGDEITVRVLPAGEADPPLLVRPEDAEWELSNGVAGADDPPD